MLGHAGCSCCWAGLAGLLLSTTLCVADWRILVGLLESVEHDINSPLIMIYVMIGVGVQPLLGGPL